MRRRIVALLIGSCVLVCCGVAPVFARTPAFFVSDAPDGPLDRGIRNVRDTIERTRRQVDGLNEEITEHLLSAVEVIYREYGKEKDPGTVILELKGLMDSLDDALEGVRAGLTGQVKEALGRAAQFALDLGSGRSGKIKAVNVGQQVAWELAEAGRLLLERAERVKRIEIDSGILATLEKKNEELAKRETELSKDPVTPPPPPPPPPPPGKTPDPRALDEAVRLLRWLDLGNRAFANRQEEDRFYADFPDLAEFRAIAEARSPADDVQFDPVDAVYRAQAQAKARAAALADQERQRDAAAEARATSDKELDDALELERHAERLGVSVHIPADRLRSAIPAGWVPCQCPARHPNAGLLIDGQRWHTPAITCEMVF